MRCKAWAVVAVALVAGVLLLHGATFPSMNSRVLAPLRLPVRFSGHWMFSLVVQEADADDINVRTSFESSQRGVEPLLVHVQTHHPLHVVARSPSFVHLVRPNELPDPPIGSVYIDRPPVGSLVNVETNCLRTREPLLRTANVTEWSVEAVVLFLDSPHFGRAWQTVRNVMGPVLSPADSSSLLHTDHLPLRSSQMLVATTSECSANP